MKPQLPSVPTKDVNVFSVSWIRKLLDCVKYGMETPRGDGKTILRSGAVMSAKRTGSTGGGSSSGTAAYPCVTTGAADGGSFPVDVYKNGKDKAKTGTGNIQVLQLHISSEIPVGTWLMGFETTLTDYNDEA